MIQDIAPHVYQNAFAAKRAPEGGDFVLLYRENGLLVRKGEQIAFPTVEDVLRVSGRCLPFSGGEDGTWRVQDLPFVFLFEIDQTAFYGLDEFPEELADRLAGRLADKTADRSTDKQADGLTVKQTGGPAEKDPDGAAQEAEYTFLPLGDLRTAKPGWLAFAGITGAQLFRWRQDRRFCGHCGARMRPSRTERAFICDGCGAVVYPKISPAVIVAVIHKDRILLTKYAHRSYARYALIAGFTEIGETIEETVHREVMEEAGVRVKNLRFYKSQPWSFSDTLLMGFFCELDGEDETITLDETELAVGTWMKREEMPDRSDDISLTSEMMEQFRRGMDPYHQGKEEP